ncbi:MAG: hypothetical protein NC094_12105 [Bacteroidales bacterium]|nr:hypothetical protein [Lachnoclostridium sp.]MCM1385261.1 hypothetical protein [Lachnoclostridium sp.]MCM1466153.1 hypothetical protein [Bacteroidales bacterium]
MEKILIAKVKLDKKVVSAKEKVAIQAEVYPISDEQGKRTFPVTFNGKRW